MGKQNGTDKDNANLAQVRDLLFGAEIREHEERFVNLEAKIDKEVKFLRDGQKKQTAELKALIRAEIATLTQSLKAESSERSAATRGLAKEAKELAAVVQRNSNQFENQLVKTEQALRTGAENAVEALREECEQQLAEHHEEITSALADLEQAKADRELLGSVFEDLAKRVRKKRS